MVWASVFIVLLVGCVFFYNQLAKLDALADEAWKEALNRFDAATGCLRRLPTRRPAKRSGRKNCAAGHAGARKSTRT